MSIMAIVLVLGIAKYNEFNRRQILYQATLELKSNLRLVQDKALSGEKDSLICPSKTLEGWYISFTGNSYEVYGQCGGTVFSRSQTFDLSQKHITISLSGTSGNYVRFKPLGHGSEEDITITLGAFGMSSRILVTKAGQIE
jgi:Tfp pilus assembly protein FimT